MLFFPSTMLPIMKGLKNNHPYEHIWVLMKNPPYYTLNLWTLYLCILSTYHPEYVIQEMIKLKIQKNYFLQIYVCCLALCSQILGQKNIGVLALCKKSNVKFLPWPVTFVVSSLVAHKARIKWSISQTFIFKRGDEAEYFIYLFFLTFNKTGWGYFYKVKLGMCFFEGGHV